MKLLAVTLALLSGCDLYYSSSKPEPDAAVDARPVDTAPDAWQPSQACNECCGKISLVPEQDRLCVEGRVAACESVCKPPPS